MKTSTLAPIIVSIVVLLGFIMISFLALKPQAAGVDDKLVVLLFGSWSTLAGIAVNFWFGSSSSSKQKDDTIASISAEKKP